METIEIPSIRLDREAFERIREALMVVLSLLSFWVMAAAETSHHYQYHYKFYPSLTFFVWVGVLSFVYTLGMAVGTRTGALGVELRRQLETAGPPVLAWLTYTAAIAASATSTDLHATFDESDGPVCKARHGAGKEPDRAQWYARKKRQNVKYVESVDGDPKTDWGVRILATRDVKPGERLLADYGEHYWAAWRLLFGDAMRAFVDDVGALFMDRGDAGGACGVAALLRYARERRVFAAPSRPNDFPAARPFWRAAPPDWRALVGKVVATPARLGYDDELGKVASLVVDGSYGDPALAALRNAAPGSGAVEATWSDGLNYAVAAVTYEAGGDAACTFLDGTTHAVPAGKVLPALSPANWRSLARLPLGAWCRPLGWEPASHWGVVEACREAADGRATYAVRMDDVRRPIDVDDDALEPVVLVRGDPRRGEHWQRAYAASALSPLPRGAAS
ncbi:hypothetical protein SO694_0016108 [Aureococcus anophagefferens]|uniref:Casparian strip membrane protein domain-containing protein n=1 Tax=Aureococcus anophagefferens TaxID=44056 RepID=A0ABR1G6G5_AURAN